MLVIEVLGRQTQVDSWGSLSCQPSLISEPQVGEEPCLKQTNKQTKTKDSE